MLSELTKEVWLQNLHGHFWLQIGPQEPIGLELVEVKSLGEKPSNDRREPFSLVFQGPSLPMLTQQMYTLQNEHIGDLNLFLVPIGAESGRFVYEAIFT